MANMSALFNDNFGKMEKWRNRGDWFRSIHPWRIWEVHHVDPKLIISLENGKAYQNRVSIQWMRCAYSCYIRQHSTKFRLKHFISGRKLTARRGQACRWYIGKESQTCLECIAVTKKSFFCKTLAIDNQQLVYWGRVKHRLQCGGVDMPAKLRILSLQEFYARSRYQGQGQVITSLPFIPASGRTLHN